MRRALAPVLLLCLSGAGCAQLNHLASSVSTTVNTTVSTAVSKVRSIDLRPYLPPEGLIPNSEQQKALQQQFGDRKAQIEQKARDGEITWAEAARQVRNLHRRSGWDFERADEEFHTYNVTIAEQLDAGRLTFAQYDALRTQRFNEIERRRGR